MARTRQQRKVVATPDPSVTKLVGDEIQRRVSWKWSEFVDGKNGFLYGIPANAPHVVKFDPEDKSMTEIGPDLSTGSGFPFKWRCGVRANNGNIYCAPCSPNPNERMLKINTNDDTVKVLDHVDLPEIGESLWKSGALASDNCIYYMPFRARCILRLDPDTETLTSVGEDLEPGGDAKYSGSVLGTDNCIYGIPYEATCIAKFDPTDPGSISFVGEKYTGCHEFECGNGVLACDGHIYAATPFSVVLQIDTTNNKYTLFDSKLSYNMAGWGWGNPIVGVDKCIYWPPEEARSVLKFDPGATRPSSLLVGEDLDELCFEYPHDYFSYLGGALANDGVIYCVPYEGNRLLAIDPWEELSMILKNSLNRSPGKLLGRLFEKNECSEIFYESAVRKFSCDRVLMLLDKLLPSKNEAVTSIISRRGGGGGGGGGQSSWSNYPLFVVAASCENSHVDVVYHLLRRNVQPLLEHVSILITSSSSSTANDADIFKPRKERKLDGGEKNDSC